MPECDYAPVQCPKGCGVLFERRFQEQHMKTDCQKRSISCEFCKKDIKQEQQIEHWNACPKFPMECPNRCGRKDVPREEV